jgi:hypothetical protein
MLSLFFVLFLPIFLIGFSWSVAYLYKVLEEDASRSDSRIGHLSHWKVLILAVRRAPRLMLTLAWDKLCWLSGWLLMRARWGVSLGIRKARESAWRGHQDGAVTAPVQRVRPVPAAGGPGPDATPDTVRDVPSLRDDLRAAPPDPAVIGQQDVPALWVQLSTAIAGFVPENEAGELSTVRGWSAGLLHFSQAILAHTDNLTAVWNLSPAIIAGLIEIADSAMDASLLVAAHNQRMVAEYAATRNAVADGTPLPNNARQWFGDGAAA